MGVWTDEDLVTWARLHLGSGMAWHFSAPRPTMRDCDIGRPIQRHVSSENPFKLAERQPQDSEPVTGLGASGSPIHGRKRNSSLAGFDSSPASPSVESPDHHGGDDSHGRKRPVKRACNECRQQKVRFSMVIYSAPPNHLPNNPS